MISATLNGTTMSDDRWQYLSDGDIPARMRLTRLSTVKPERIEWLWPNRFAIGKLNLVGGYGGEGKSTLTRDIAARVSSGTPWPDSRDTPNPKGRVLMFISEDGLSDCVAPGLLRHGADASMIDVVEAVGEVDKSGERSFNLHHDLALLDLTLEQLGDVRLLVFDALNSYCGKDGFNAGKDVHVRAVLEPLTRLAHKHRVCIIGIGHLGKGDHQRAQNKYLDSVAYMNVARAGWLVTRDKADADLRLFLNCKMNIAKPAPNIAFRIEDGEVRWLDGSITTSADEAFAAQDDNDTPRTKVDECADFLRELLASNDMASRDVLKQAKEAGFGEKCVDRAKPLAQVRSYMFTGTPRPSWYMTLSDRDDTRAPDVVPVPLVPLVPVGDMSLLPKKDIEGQGRQASVNGVLAHIGHDLPDEMEGLPI